MPDHQRKAPRAGSTLRGADLAPHADVVIARLQTPGCHPHVAGPGQVERGRTQELDSKEAEPRDKTGHPPPLASLQLGPGAGHSPVNWPGGSTTCSEPGAWGSGMLDQPWASSQPKTPAVGTLSLAGKGPPHGGLVPSKSI